MRCPFPASNLLCQAPVAVALYPRNALVECTFDFAQQELLFSVSKVLYTGVSCRASCCFCAAKVVCVYLVQDGVLHCSLSTALYRVSW